MKPAERVIVYGLLGLLLVMNLSSLTKLSGSTAYAAAMAALDALGPAESVTLSADGQKDVVLRNRKGRLAWTDNDYGKAYTNGFVHIGKVLNKLMDAKALAEERDALGEELKKKEDDYRSRLTGLRQKGEGLDRESPDLRAIIEEYTKVTKEYQEWSAEAGGRFNKLNAEQLEKCYRDLVNAVEIVGDRKGVDMVYRFIPTSEKFDASDREQALNAIRLRTVLKYPDGLDITPEVLEELSLPVD